MVANNIIPSTQTICMIATNSNKRVDEKESAIEYILTSLFGSFPTPLSVFQNLLSDTLYNQPSLRLIQMLVRAGAPIELFFEKLTMRRFQGNFSSGQVEPPPHLIKDCLTYILTETNFVIPPDQEQYQHREKYRLNGLLYDWLIETHPKTKEVIQTDKSVTECIDDL